MAGILALGRVKHGDFVRANTVLMPVPFVPEVVMHTATAVTPLWQATEQWLGRAGVDVPFWSVPWAGGQALARWVLDNHDAVRGKRVIDVGAGGGLVAIAAALAGAAHVRAIDIDAVACAACALNAAANGVAIAIENADATRVALEADVVLAADVWYERALAERMLAALGRARARVVTADPGRAYAPTALVTLATYEVPTPLDLESVPSRATRVAELSASGESER
jgi:predicted nicotinamide N-methyase